MKTLSSILCLSLLLTGQALTADPVEFQVNLKKGDKLPVRMVMEQAIQQEFQGMKMSVDQTMRMDYTSEVTDVDDQGVATLKVTYTRVMMKMKNPMMNLEYDSANPPKELSPLVTGFAALADASFTFKMSKTGQIVDADTEAMTKKMVAGLPDDPQSAQLAERMQDQFSSEKMKQQLGIMSDIFPGKPVVPGDQWQKTASMSAPMAMTVDSAYTLKEVKDGMAAIAHTAKIATDPKAPGMAMLPNAKVDLKGEQSGQTLVELKTGWAQETAITQKITGNLSVANPQTGEDIKIPMDITSQIRIYSGKKLAELIAKEKEEAEKKAAEPEPKTEEKAPEAI